MRSTISKLFLVLFSMPLLSTSQGVVYDRASKKAQQLFNEAERTSMRHDYKSADSLYAESIKAESRFLDGYWYKGNLNLEQIQNYDEAIRCFNKVIELDKNFKTDVYMKLGTAQMYKQDYNAARSAFREYDNMKSASPDQKLQAQNYVKSCDFAEVAIQHPIKFAPKNIGPAVNTGENELMPTVTADERFLYYTRDEMAGQYLDENIYMTEHQFGVWGPARLVDRPVSTYEFLEGATCISPNGKYLFFTSCGRPDSEGDCDIYFTQRTLDGWDTPKNPGKPVNSPGWDIQPSISPDSRTLFFASRRNGGYGGLDIYVTTLDANFKWTEPVNLGPEINTVNDEERPFIHPDGQTLYFSSDGHPGFGRADFYVTRRTTDGKWMKPQNLGWPLNSPGDEIGICISASGRTGYFASERPEGRGGMDIYSFETDESFRPVYVTYVKGKVFSKDSKAPLKASIKIYDINQGVLYNTLSTDAKTGTYLTTLPVGKDFAFEVTAEDHLFHSENFSLRSVESTEPFLVDVPLQRINPGITVVMRNIFFDSDKYVLKDESKAELKTLIELMSKNPNLKIEIGGHTDNTGGKEKNLQLSQNRAQAVHDYLAENGIAADRLTYKGYGDTMPVAENTTAEGKAQNRRTEFKVISN